MLRVLELAFRYILPYELSMRIRHIVLRSMHVCLSQHFVCFHGFALMEPGCGLMI